MYGDRALSMLVQPEQWARCAHQNTALLPGGGVVLDWAEALPDAGADGRCTEGPPPQPVKLCPTGLAFDRWCRAYRSRPGAGTVDVLDPESTRGLVQGAGAIGRPTGLAVDRSQQLYIVESSGHAVLVVDLWAHRLLRRVPFGRTRPVDVALDCGRAAVLLRRPEAIVFLEGRRGPKPGPALVNPRCLPALEPTRITSGLLVLWSDAGHGVIAAADGTVELEIEGATDLEATPEGLLVVARAPGEPFRRFQKDDDGAWVELEPAAAPDYDGGAVTVSPDGRIVFTTADGFGTTTGSAARHEPSGSVVTYRLDSGRYRTRWGRVFLDACLPEGTGATLEFLTSDGEDVLDPVEATPPTRGHRAVPRPDQTPPLPSQSLLDTLVPDSQQGALFRRPTGREQPWQQIPPEDSFDTYESQVIAPPGRYLWLKLSLTGTARTSPRIRAIRVERPGHQLLNSLPRAWSRDDADADFLHRFLAPLEGTLHELDWKAAERALLLDPRTTPQDALPWLASFAGLVLDHRWPEEARRTLVAEAYRLFARRGTRASLVRILELYLGRAPSIIEAWQLRGLGGMVLGAGPEGAPAPAVRGNARATGVLGRFAIGGSAPAGPDAAAGKDSFELSAHRFTLLVPGNLTPDQRTVVHSIVEVHRPAHTIFEICELGAGMRVGQRLHLNLTSFVGPDTGWSPAVLGQFRVGGDGVVGTPEAGSRLGQTSVGRVRIG